MERETLNEVKFFSKELTKIISGNEIEKIGKECEFVKRKSKFQTQDLVKLCVFLSQKLASDPLVKLCCRLESETKLIISSEGLNQRLNAKAVSVLKELLRRILFSKINNVEENKLLCHKYFNRIRISDSTVFQLPDTFEDTYKGFGGSSNTSSVKIHLEYDLLSGGFLNLISGPGNKSDYKYGLESLTDIQANDLFLRDLGYFNFLDLKLIDDKKSFYVSRIKLDTAIYIKNENPEFHKNGNLKRSSEFVRLELENIINKIDFGESIEIPEVICGRDKNFKTRLVIYHLQEDELNLRIKKQNLKERKKGIKLSEKSRNIQGLNFYITNIPKNIATIKEIHNIYSLRWQIEIFFKMWKSFFQIQNCKEIKIERLECHLYGQLIGILITSSVIYKMRRFLYMKNIEMSEYKGFYTVMEYLKHIYFEAQKGIKRLSKLLIRILTISEKNSKKSHRKNRKNVFDIIDAFNYYNTTEEKIA